MRATQTKGKELAAARWLKMIVEAQIKRGRLLGLEAEAAPIVVRREPIASLKVVLGPSRDEFETEEEWINYYQRGEARREEEELSAD